MLPQHINFHTEYDQLCVFWWTTSSVCVWRPDLLQLVAEDHSLRGVTGDHLVSTIIWHITQHVKRKINIANDLLILVSYAFIDIIFVGEKQDSWSQPVPPIR